MARTQSTFERSLNAVLPYKASHRQVARLPEAMLEREVVAAARGRLARDASATGILALTRESFVFVPESGKLPPGDLRFDEVTQYEAGSGQTQSAVRVARTDGGAFEFIAWHSAEVRKLTAAIAEVAPAIPVVVQERALITPRPQAQQAPTNGARNAAIFWTLVMIAIAIIWAIVASHNESDWRQANCQDIFTTCPNYSGLAAGVAVGISASIWFSGLVVIAIFAFLSRKPQAAPVAAAVAPAPAPDPAGAVAPVTAPAGVAPGAQPAAGDPSPQAVATAPSLTDELTRLAELHRSNALTDDEYTRAKALLLGG